MSSTPSNQDIFDVRRIRRLVELMNEHDLSEIDLRQADTRVRIRRGGEVVMSPMVERPAAAPASVAATAAEPARPAAPAAQPAAQDEHAVLIKSPMVGTFYTAPDPDSPPYVQVGDHVGPEKVVCIVEAMKVFNQIQAEVSGKIIAVLVENGAPVEFGQPLFKVDTKQ